MCTSPITLKVDNHFGLRSLVVPCGKCDECKKQYQNDWMVRLCEEARNYKKLTFFTLTYNEDSVPYIVDTQTGERHLSVCKEHVQQWLKRFRTYASRHNIDSHFKYFITSEYGPRTLRPHYHGIIFGLSKYDLLESSKDWQNRFGFVRFDDVPIKPDDCIGVARYVSKYCSKGSFENPKVKAGLVRPTFHLISHKIGWSYVLRMKAWHLGHNLFKFHDRIVDLSRCKYSEAYLQFVSDNKCVRLTADSRFKYHMPRYYAIEIYGSQNSLSTQIADFLFKKSCKLRDERARKLQADHPSWSFSKAFGVTYLQDTDERLQRSLDAHASLARFYECSKL